MLVQLNQQIFKVCLYVDLIQKISKQRTFQKHNNNHNLLKRIPLVLIMNNISAHA